MAGLIYNRDKELVEWAEKAIGFSARPDARAIGWSDDTGIRAVTVFDTFSDTECCMHIASDGSGKWLTRTYLGACFAYPFIQCGFKRVTGLVPASNAEALRFDEHLGFVREGVLREAAEDGDLIIMGLLRRECRFIPLRHRNG